MKLADVVLPGLLSTALFLPNGAALSQPAVQKILSSQAQGLDGPISTLTVWPGAGTNLSVIPTGETIRKVILDDPSQIGLDFDGPMCVVQSNSDSAKSCEKSAASVIHLRRTTKLNFKQLPKAKSRTLLTVVTEETTGKKKVYPFWVSLGTGEPQYQTLAIYPDVQPQEAPQALSVLPQVQLARIAQGLEVARSQGLIYSQQPLWGKMQRFMGLVQSGESMPAAAQQSGVSMALVTKLSELGSPSSVFPPPLSSPKDGIRRPTLPKPISR